MPPPPGTQHPGSQPGVPPAGRYPPGAAPPREIYPPRKAPGEVARTGQYADMWNPPPPSGRYPPPRKAGEKKQAPIALIIIIAVGIALIGGGAVAYFAFLRPDVSANVAQETIDEYFNALGSGDTETIKSLHASDMQPSSEELNALSYIGDMITYSDIKLKTIDESAGEMLVEIIDFVVTLSFMGQSESMKMSEVKSKAGLSGNTVVRLKEVGGKWLIDEPDVLSPFDWMLMDMPDVPGTTVPSDGG